jgi:HlyD family secretion protein
MTAPRPKRSLLRPIVFVIVAAAIGWYIYHRYELAHAPFRWSGTVEARTIQLGSRAGGRIADIRVKEGDHVVAGQPLVVLEPGDWLAQLEQAEAALVQAGASLDKLKAGSRPEEIEAARARARSAEAALQEAVKGPRPQEIAAARDRLAAEEAAVAKARLDAERLHKLRDAGAAVPADVDNADIALRTASAQRDAAKHELDQLEAGSRHEQVAQAQARANEQRASERLVTAGSRIEDIQIAHAQVEAARGKVDQIKSMIDELAIKAPTDGRKGWGARVESLDLRPGDIIAPSSTAVTLVEDDQLYVRIYVPETQLGHIAIHQKVSIEVDSFPDQRFEGIVQHINQIGEYSPRNLQTADERANQVFATRVGILTGADKLRAGMAAFIEVPRD